MKATTFIAILLTFLMAILVLSAAVVFLLQGRQDVMDAADVAVTGVAALESTRVQLEASLGAIDAERATSVANLSTAEAEVAGLQGQLIQSDQAATSALATVLAPTPTAASDLAPPTVEFLSPRVDDVFQVDDTIPIAFTVYHPAGLGQVQLSIETVNEILAVETSPITGEPYQRFDVDYTLDAAQFDIPQAIVISVVATSTLSVANEPESVTVTVSVPAPEPTATPNASPETPTTPTTVPPTSTPESAIDSPRRVAELPAQQQFGRLSPCQVRGSELV